MASAWQFPYPSQRMPVLAEQVVATSQPLAAEAGLDALRRGGTAVDAVVAAAAALTVVEPTSNGLGSDAFALVWDGTALHGLNASGRSPAGLDAERFLGRAAMPTRGWDPVTVPGAVSAWAALATRFGRLGLDALVEPAARYAERGWPVGPITAAAWAQASQRLAGVEGFAEAFLPGGRAPRPGERFALPAQAATLRAIGRSDGEALYRGEIAERLLAAARAAGAPWEEADLAGHRPEWVEPLVRSAFGLEIAELPPNGQGIAALAALGILERTGAADGDPDDAATIHLAVEAMRRAFGDAHAEVADPTAMRVTATELLDAGRLSAHAAAIDPERATGQAPGSLLPGGTVYLAAADGQGRMASYIQSNYMGFGSGVVVPGTGVSLQNRGAGFATTRGHPNAVDGGKRPFHTIIPAFAFADGEPRLAFGVMGGHMQPQGHLQMALRLGAHGQNPQAAVDAPRWRVDPGRRVAVEAGLDGAVAEGLRHRGHDVVVSPPGLSDASFGFGGAQLVERLPEGIWLAASDPRKEGGAVGF
ncbi:MAG: gamma-glutamyltransferase family protein [Egibacteraceae bacterium]